VIFPKSGEESAPETGQLPRGVGHRPTVARWAPDSVKGHMVRELLTLDSRRAHAMTNDFNGVSNWTMATGTKPGQRYVYCEAAESGHASDALGVAARPVPDQEDRPVTRGARREPRRVH
jgi:hypothetical protein